MPFGNLLFKCHRRAQIFPVSFADLAVPEFWYPISHIPFIFRIRILLTLWEGLSVQSSWIFVTSCGICRSVGVSLTKGEHLSIFCTKKVPTKKASIMHLLLHFVTLPSWWVMRSMDGSLTRFGLAESLDSDTAMALVSSAPVASFVAEVNSSFSAFRGCPKTKNGLY